MKSSSRFSVRKRKIMPQTCRVSCPECNARLRYSEAAERSTRLMQCPHCSVSFVANFQADKAASANAMEPTRVSPVTSFNDNATSSDFCRSSEPMSLPAYVSSTPTRIRSSNKPWLQSAVRVAGLGLVVVLIGAASWFLLRGPVRNLAANLPGIPSFRLVADTPDERAKAIAEKAKEEQQARKLAESKAVREKAKAEEKAKRDALAVVEEKARRERAEAFAKEKRERNEKLEADLAAKMRGDSIESMQFPPGVPPTNPGRANPYMPTPAKGFNPEFAQEPGIPNRPGISPPGFAPFGPNAQGMPGFGNTKGPLADLPREKLLIIEVQSKSQIDNQAIVKLLAEKLSSRRYQFSSSGKEVKTIIARFAFDKSLEDAKATLGPIVVKSDEATRTLTIDGDQLLTAP